MLRRRPLGVDPAVSLIVLAQSSRCAVDVSMVALLRSECSKATMLHSAGSLKTGERPEPGDAVGARRAGRHCRVRAVRRRAPHADALAGSAAPGYLPP